MAKRADQKRKLCEKYANEFFPRDKIELLIIGESPPISKKYFYIPDNLSYQSLPAKIFRVLFSAGSSIDEIECKDYLIEFQHKNFLLTDLCSFPIDCFTSSIRAEIIENEIFTFLETFNSLNFSAMCNTVLVLPSGTFKELKKKKYKTTWNLLEKQNLPIIKWGEIEKHLAEVSDSLRKRGVL